MFRAMTLESFLSCRLVPFCLGGSFMAPIIQGVKTCAPGPLRPFSPSVPAEAGCLFELSGGTGTVYLSCPALRQFEGDPTTELHLH